MAIWTTHTMEVTETLGSMENNWRSYRKDKREHNSTGTNKTTGQGKRIRSRGSERPHRDIVDHSRSQRTTEDHSGRGQPLPTRADRLIIEESQEWAHVSTDGRILNNGGGDLVDDDHEADDDVATENSDTLTTQEYGGLEHIPT